MGSPDDGGPVDVHIPGFPIAPVGREGRRGVGINLLIVPDRTQTTKSALSRTVRRPRSRLPVAKPPLKGTSRPLRVISDLEGRIRDRD